MLPEGFQYPSWAVSVLAAVTVVWWVLRLLRVQHHMVVSDLARYERELQERDEQVDRLEAENAELRAHVRRCEDELARIARRLEACEEKIRMLTGGD